MCVRVCTQVCRCINLARGQLNREVGGQVVFFFFPERYKLPLYCCTGYHHLRVKKSDSGLSCFICIQSPWLPVVWSWESRFDLSVP